MPDLLYQYADIDDASRKIEEGVRIIEKMAHTIFKILDEYENLVETKN